MDHEIPFIKDMFEKISPNYDFLNRFLSLRQDVYWRKALAKEIYVPDGGKILDSATGTGDVALEIMLQKKKKKFSIYCVDFSISMLLIAQKKIEKKKLSNIKLIAGNALYPSFPDETFDAAVIAFGIRNINDKLAALKIFYSLIKKGGMFLVLELGIPEESFLAKIYLLYFKKLLPLIGRIFSKSSFAYNYLPNSVALFPKPLEFIGLMQKVGFKNIKRKKMSAGMANLFIGYK